MAQQRNSRVPFLRGAWRRRDMRPRCGITTLPPTLPIMAYRAAGRSQHGSSAMSSSKSRLLLSGLAVAGLGALALGYAAPQLSRSLLPRAEQSALVPATTSADSAPVRVAAMPKDGARVDAPGAQVETGRNVRVQAPGT